MIIRSENIHSIYSMMTSKWIENEMTKKTKRMKEKKLKTKHNSNLLISLYRDYALGNLTII